MADDPTDIRSSPVHLARAHPVDRLHRPLQSDGVAAVVSHDALRQAGGPRRVEDVQRIGSRDRYARNRQSPVHAGVPLDVPPRLNRARTFRALEHNAANLLPVEQLECAVHQRLVRRDPGRRDAARRAYDHLRSRIDDPGGQLVGAEPAEHDRMDGPEAGAREHRDHRLGDHRHVDDHAIAPTDAFLRQCAGEPGHLVEELPIRVAPYNARHRAVVDQRRLLAAPVAHMAIERVEAGVELPTREPRRAWRRRRVENRIGRAIPIDRRARGSPELLWVLSPLPVCVIVTAHQRLLRTGQSRTDRSVSDVVSPARQRPASGQTGSTLRR